MNKRMRGYLTRVLRDNDANAYRKLAMAFLRGDGCPRDVALGKLCLQKAMLNGDEQSFFLYHRIFSQGKKVIDDSSYEDFVRQWHQAKHRSERRRIRHYLQLGTKKQKLRALAASKTRPGCEIRICETVPSGRQEPACDLRNPIA